MSRFRRDRRTPPEHTPSPVLAPPQPTLLAAGVLKGRFDALLAEQVRPLLKEQGFAKSGATFSRRRPPLYDVINFQGSDVNGTGMLHRFYVNVGIGSFDVDAVEAEATVDRPRLQNCLISGRWREFVDDAPARVEIDSTSDLALLATDVRHWLSLVVTVLDGVDSTNALVDLAIEGNYLHQMQKTCAYLARAHDLERLRRYIGLIRGRFDSDLRWAAFNRQICEAVGGHAAEFRAEGLLDDDTGH